MTKYFGDYTITFLFFVLVSLVLPNIVYAYLDLGTGSYILQLILGALLGGLYAIKLYWKKIKNFFKNIFSKGEKA